MPFFFFVEKMKIDEYRLRKKYSTVKKDELPEKSGKGRTLLRSNIFYEDGNAKTAPLCTQSTTKQKQKKKTKRETLVR